jgi:serine phosphatase RsbU (regulator of sigma subunit)/anti-sigma regulatory factor (Ser/Thr protein kinase)
MAPSSIGPERTRFSVVAQLAAVAPAVERLCVALAIRGADARAVADVRLVASEAITNAVKHGRGPRGAAGIEVEWSWHENWLELAVSEPGHFVPPPDWAELPADPMKESGRGGFLIAQHVDAFRHENRDGRHTLALRKNLRAAPAGLQLLAQLDATLAAATEELSTSYEILSALFGLAAALATSEDVRDFAKFALRLRELVEADSVHVRLKDANGDLSLLAGVGGLPDPVLRADSGAIETVVFKTGAEKTVEHRAGLPATDPLHADTGGAVVCPVHFQGRQLGVCVVTRDHAAEFFTAGQLALARATAEFLGIACANAQLQAQRLAQLQTRRELELAVQIQRSLLPAQTPARKDWRMHGVCHNAAQAGGDFFDIIEVNGGVLLVIADVMGKGMPAAMLASVLRTAFRAHAAHAENPGDLMNAVSAQVTPDLERLDVFVTAELVFLAANAALIRYANAGHGPVLLCRAKQAHTEFLSEGGLPLGVSQTERYASHAIPLARGDRLLLVTDGVTEAADAGGAQYGYDRLAALALQQSPHDLSALSRAVLSAIAAFAGSDAAPDDQTLLVAECLV